MFVTCKRYTLSGLISTPTLEKTRRQSVKDLMHVFARRVRAGLTALAIAAPGHGGARRWSGVALWIWMVMTSLLPRAETHNIAAHRSLAVQEPFCPRVIQTEGLS